MPAPSVTFRSRLHRPWRARAAGRAHVELKVSNIMPSESTGESQWPGEYQAADEAGEGDRERNQGAEMGKVGRAENEGLPGTDLSEGQAAPLDHVETRTLESENIVRPGCTAFRWSYAGEYDGWSSDGAPGHPDSLRVCIFAASNAKFGRLRATSSSPEPVQFKNAAIDGDLIWCDWLEKVVCVASE